MGKLVVEQKIVSVAIVIILGLVLLQTFGVIPRKKQVSTYTSDVSTEIQRIKKLSRTKYQAGYVKALENCDSLKGLTPYILMALSNRDEDYRIVSINILYLQGAMGEEILRELSFTPEVIAFPERVAERRRVK